MNTILTHSAAFILGVIACFFILRNNPKLIAQATADIATLNTKFSELKGRVDGIVAAVKGPTS